MTLTEFNPPKIQDNEAYGHFHAILVVNKLWIYRAVDHVYDHSITAYGFSHVNHMSPLRVNGGGAFGGMVAELTELNIHKYRIKTLLVFLYTKLAIHNFRWGCTLFIYSLNYCFYF